MATPILNLKDVRRGMLVAQHPCPPPAHLVGRPMGRQTWWLCACDCGQSCVAPATAFNHWHKTHCGCVAKARREKAGRVTARVPRARPAVPAGSLPDVLARLRAARGLSQAALGKILGLSNVTVAHHERGVSQPSAAAYLAYSEVYGWSEAGLVRMMRLGGEFPWAGNVPTAKAVEEPVQQPAAAPAV